MGNQEQRSKDYLLITPQDVATAGATATTTYVGVGPEYKAGKVIVSAHLTATKTAVAALQEATDSSGTSATAVSGKTVTLTGEAGGSDEIGVIEFKASDLSTGYPYVGVTVTTNENGDDICATLLLVEPRKGQATMPETS